MLRELGLLADTQPTIPEVRAERCVHSLLEQASCRGCVDACPRDAWIINDEMLGIDAERCDGCELCAAACPEAAIVQRFRPVVRRTRLGIFALACCEHAPLQGQALPRMPCLHGIGLSNLLGLAREQVQHLITASGDCSGCPRGTVERLDERIEVLNRLLSKRGLPVITHQALEAGRWSDAWHQANAAANQKPISRRGFFRSALAEPRRHIEGALERAEGRPIAPGSLLPRRSPRDPSPFAPTIDTLRCSGCDACVRLCPHEAIRMEVTDGVPIAYVFDADRCTGCGICTDVCDRAAIRIGRWEAVPESRLALTNRRCADCGVTYHMPQCGERSRTATSRCPICVKTRHHGNLYQVLD
jgi:ferredoxin